MALPELVRRRGLAAAALAGVLVGAVIGLFLPIRAAAPPKPDDTPWSLPNVTARTRRPSGNVTVTLRPARSETCATVST